MIAITAGEPAGIGADILIDALERVDRQGLLVIADPDWLVERATQLGRNLSVVEYTPESAQSTDAKIVRVLPVKLANASRPGNPDPANARYVLNTLDHAIDLCQSGIAAAMVTAPVHKGIINDAGIPFSGHTEYLAEKTDAARPVMMLCHSHLRVALATTHLPLRDVSDQLTQELLIEVLTILDADLRGKFGIDAPRILVCGLNPHAGEGGHLGSEEIDTIEPALQTLRRQGLNLIGPLPADTLFTPRWLEQADAVLAMYHDQGLPVLKYSGFGDAVNVTLGLPLIRTSVDHGTAFDLAGTGRADCGSLLAAIELASRLSAKKSQA